MAVTPGILADGQLPAAVAALYTAGGDVYVTTIIITNVSAAQRTVNLYARDSVSAADRSIIPDDLVMDVGDCLTLQVRASLNNGDAIRGDADAAASVDYVIWGGT